MDPKMIKHQRLSPTKNFSPAREGDTWFSDVSLAYKETMYFSISSFTRMFRIEIQKSTTRGNFITLENGIHVTTFVTDDLFCDERDKQHRTAATRSFPQHEALALYASSAVKNRGPTTPPASPRLLPSSFHSAAPAHLHGLLEARSALDRPEVPPRSLEARVSTGGGGRDGAGAEPGGVAPCGRAGAAPAPAWEGAAGGWRRHPAADLHACALLRARPRPPPSPILLPPGGQRLAPHRYVAVRGIPAPIWPLSPEPYLLSCSPRLWSGSKMLEWTSGWGCWWFDEFHVSGRGYSVVFEVEMFSIVGMNGETHILDSSGTISSDASSCVSEFCLALTFSCLTWSKYYKFIIT